MDSFADILADVEHKRLQSNIALARASGVEVEDMLMRLAKLLPYAADHPQALSELTDALLVLRSSFMGLERSILEAHPEVNARAS